MYFFSKQYWTKQPSELDKDKINWSIVDQNAPVANADAADHENP